MMLVFFIGLVVALHVRHEPKTFVLPMLTYDQAHNPYFTSELVINERPVRMIVDTGSHELLFQAEGKDRVPKLLANTSQVVYESGTIFGAVKSDNVCLAKSCFNQSVFEALQSQALVKWADGVLGLQGGPATFLETMKTSGLISENSFTLKFSKSGKSGSLVLGDTAGQNSTTCKM
jgi:hypothetical protein